MGPGLARTGPQAKSSDGSDCACSATSRGHRERADLRRPRRGRQHQPRRLGYLLARDSGTQPVLHHLASGKRARQLRGKDFSHISRAGPRIEQAPVAFGCLLLALGLRAAPRLFAAPVRRAWPLP
jgi:hypothetical protein